MKKSAFLILANQLNRQFQIIPLLFGSLGLEQRLRVNLNADDIDVLIPETFLNENWAEFLRFMNDNGYTLYDLHEHEFEKEGHRIAFASMESLTPFAGIHLENIPIVEESGVSYFLLDLQDYLKVYLASSKDGYRKETKHKNDSHKIELIKTALEMKGGSL